MNRRIITLFLVLGLCITRGHAGETIYYYHNDHLGTPQAMTDENQVVKGRSNTTLSG